MSPVGSASLHCDPQIDTEAGKKVAANLKNIETDLQQMKNENIQLVTKLKSS